MKRFMRRNWLRITSWVMMPLLLVMTDSFYQLVFAASQPEPAAPIPAISGTSKLLEAEMEQIVGLLEDAEAELAGGGTAAAEGTALSQKKSSIEGLKPQMDADLAALRLQIEGVLPAGVRSVNFSGVASGLRPAAGSAMRSAEGCRGRSKASRRPRRRGPAARGAGAP